MEAASAMKPTSESFSSYFYMNISKKTSINSVAKFYWSEQSLVSLSITQLIYSRYPFCILMLQGKEMLSIRANTDSVTSKTKYKSKNVQW